LAKGVASLSGVLLLTACGGGGSSGGSASTTTTSVAAAAPITSADAVRLAKQASFGPTSTLAAHIVALGSAGAWLDEQMATSGSTYADLSTRAVPTNYCTLMATTAQGVCNRDYLSSTPVAMEFYSHAVQGGDQLRQRVAFALSQLIVTSDVEVHSTAGLATFNQILLDNAFGNYHDILKAVTLNAYMGDYLDMANSSKAAPNENYARELMQLFSMGVNTLNADGSLKTDSSGAVVPTYTADDVHNIARALTGWTYTRLNGAALTDNTNLDYSQPLIKNAALYDATAKTFLGVTVPANATQDASLQAVVDAVFNNASTAPYVSKFLIEQLVTSNPSAAYVGRISAVFANDGTGVRGNLKAVVRAILTDAEARGDSKSGASDGKVKEPVLFSTSIARLIGDATDGYAFTTRDAAMGQQPFRAPSVFNFYPPDYPLPLGGGLLSPPFKLLTAATMVARHNLAYDWTVNGDAANRSEYVAQSTIAGATGTAPDWSAWQAFGADEASMVNSINLLMLNNTMTAAQQTAILAAVNAVTNSDPTTQARKRAQTALYIVASSPQFQVDR
jgi:uncharacterized protein (DUF1800 family)